MKIICTVVLALFCFTSLASAQATCSGDWPEFLNTNMHRENPCESVLNVNNVGNLVTKWSYFTDAGMSSPAVSHGVVYTISALSSFALDAQTGALLWSTYGGYDFSLSPAVADGLVYLGAEAPNFSEGSVYAASARTGGIRWIFSTGDPSPSSPTVSNGVVYIGAGDGNVYALDATTGTELWSYHFTGSNQVYGSPAVVNGVVYVGADTTTVALDANTGAVLWSFPTAEGTLVVASPAIADGVVYIFAEGSVAGSPPSYLYAIDAQTGTLLWSRTILAGGFTSPALAYGIVFIGVDLSERGELYALNARTGAVLWGFNTGVITSPAVADGVVYVVGDKLYALNARNGAELWSYQNNYVNTSPVVSNGMLYVATAAGYLYAFGLP